MIAVDCANAGVKAWSERSEGSPGHERKVSMMVSESAGDTMDELERSKVQAKKPHRLPLKSWRVAALVVFVCFAVVILLGGCTSTIHPPKNPENPCRVYLVKEALHRGLILPVSGGGERDGGRRDYVEYGYGDWDWYARNRNSWYHVFDTVLWPTQGTLGCRWWTPQQIEWLEDQGRATAITVPTAAAQSLRADLEESFRQGATAALHNSLNGMTFVKHPHRFWCFHNCNDGVVDWLRSLDCRVSWILIRLDLDVR